VEIRYGRLHNASLSIVATAMIVVAIIHFASHPELAPAVSLHDPRFSLMVGLAIAMAFFAWQGAERFANRAPQVVINHDGIGLGFGRHKHFAWGDIEWVRLRRLALRPQLQIGLTPEAFAVADLKLSPWSLDDSLRPIRGVPAAVVVRDNGLDCSAVAMLDAVKSFRPNLVRS
jgi:hypothetical protein